MMQAAKQSKAVAFINRENLNHVQPFNVFFINYFIIIIITNFIMFSKEELHNSKCVYKSEISKSQTEFSNQKVKLKNSNIHIEIG